VTTPPTTGTTNWGGPLDTYLAALQAEADNNGVNFADHISAAPAGTPLTDPHGDRAYALGLMAPIQQLVNQPSGFVQLGPGGRLPGRQWQDLRPVSGSFAPPTGHYPPQYRTTLDGKIELAGYVVISAATYNGVTIFPAALPADCRPNLDVDILVTLSAAGSAPSAATPMMTIAADGTMTFSGLPGGLAPGTLVGIKGWFPLDSYYELLQS
jgi:hypothetical protein